MDAAIGSAKFTTEAQAVAKETIVKKWGTYLPVVTLFFPGGLFIVGAWLAVEFFRQSNGLAEECRKGLTQYCKRKEQGK
jgi:hypothetical protein